MQKKKKKTPLRRSCLHRLKRNWKVFDKHRDFPGIIKAWQHLLCIEIRLWSWVLFCSSLYLGWPVLEPQAQNTPDTVREQPLVSTSQTSSVSRDAALQPHFKAPFHNWVRMQSDMHAFNHSPSFVWFFFVGRESQFFKRKAVTPGHMSTCRQTHAHMNEQQQQDTRRGDFSKAKFSKGKRSCLLKRRK